MNEEKVKLYIQEFEDQLSTFIYQTKIPDMQLEKALQYSLFSGGKRLRPLLVYLSGELFGVNLKIVHAIAISIELTHTYSLIHDDLPAMDNDDFRRGVPSCHKKFDEATAILTGDGLQPLSIELLITGLKNLLPAEKILSIIQELINACGFNGMISGQSMDLNELSSSTIDIIKLKEIHTLKTGKLFLACVNMILAASKPSPQATCALQKFATSFGLLFQMRDDYRDMYCKISHGKRRNSDIANAKTTFATFYTKEELIALIALKKQEAAQALEFFGTDAKRFLYFLELSISEVK